MLPPSPTNKQTQLKDFSSQGLAVYLCGSTTGRRCFFLVSLLQVKIGGRSSSVLPRIHVLFVMCSLECSRFCFVFLYVCIYIYMHGWWSSEASRCLFLLLLVVSSALQHSSVMSQIVALAACEPPRDPPYSLGGHTGWRPPRLFFFCLFLSLYCPTSPGFPESAGGLHISSGSGTPLNHVVIASPVNKPWRNARFCAFAFFFLNDFKFWRITFLFCFGFFFISFCL